MRTLASRRGLVSAALFIEFLALDPSFLGWQDVYFFCGSDLRYCTCSLRWNLLGWMKALVIWNFVLTSALGLQKLVLQMGLNGLLPGEEVVTKESFISICWRLIPYWLNNWEQQWGAECSSMMFELPHFAVELLVILPSVQILCSRMKILALPLVQPLAAGDPAQPLVREEFAPNILKGFWEHSPGQAKLMPRLKANLQIMAFTVLITSMAAMNALVVPLYLEKTVSLHASTLPVLAAGRHLPWNSIRNGTAILSRDLILASGISQAHYSVIAKRFSIYADLNVQLSSTVLPPSLLEENIVMKSNISSTPVADKSTLPPSENRSILLMIFNWVFLLEEGWELEPLQCHGGVDKLATSMKKHAGEITKMLNPEHTALIPLVESALALMRLSCEKYFVLVAVFVSYLLFREPPRAARLFIILSSRLSTVFQKVILYSFPAICWIYGAGFIFSTFVSVVFWGAPIHQLYHSFRGNSSIVRIKSLKSATAADIERMGGNCAICWGDMRSPEGGATGQASPSSPSSDNMDASGAAPAATATTTAAADPSAEGFSLSCGHAYHHACLHQWLHQCHSQGTPPTCPMCQATIQLEIQWRMPWQWKSEGGARRRRRAGRVRGGIRRPVMMDQGEGIPGGGGGGGGGALDPQQGLALQDAQGAPLMPLPNNAVNQEDLRMLGLLDHEMEVHELLRDMPQILPPGGDFLMPPEEIIMPELDEPQVPPEQRQAQPEAPVPPPQHQEQQQQQQQQLNVNHRAQEVASRSQELDKEEEQVPPVSPPGPSGAHYASSSAAVARGPRDAEIAPEDPLLPPSPSIGSLQAGGDAARAGGGQPRRRGFGNFFGKRRQA